jgi:hypothetical protein
VDDISGFLFHDPESEWNNSEDVDSDEIHECKDSSTSDNTRNDNMSCCWNGI